MKQKRSTMEAHECAMKMSLRDHIQRGKAAKSLMYEGLGS